jgi:DNA-binding transcriptional ArsR family regulator
MPRPCSICAHPDRLAIERELLAAVSFRSLADRYGVSLAALSRHVNAHMPRSLARAQALREEGEVASAEALLAEVCSLRDRALGILDLAELQGDPRTALMALRELRATLELIGRLVGQLASGVSVTITSSSEWLELRGRILEALAPFPDARLALAQAIEPEADGI